MSGKNNKIINSVLKYFSCYFAVMAVVITIVYQVAEAGEREILWTEIMRFVNFGVLVFLFLKFARKPLINFLKGEGNKISEQLQKIDADVNEARSGMEVELDKFENINDNLVSITESIIAAGAREKKNVIEKANAVADKMVEDAKKNVAFKMDAAKKRFSEEMLEIAVKISGENIKKNITKEEDEGLVRAFSSGLSSHHNISL